MDALSRLGLAIALPLLFAVMFHVMHSRIRGWERWRSNLARRNSRWMLHLMDGADRLSLWGEQVNDFVEALFYHRLVFFLAALGAWWVALLIFGRDLGARVGFPLTAFWYQLVFTLFIFGAVYWPLAGLLKWLSRWFYEDAVRRAAVAVGWLVGIGAFVWLTSTEFKWVNANSVGEFSELLSVAALFAGTLGFAAVGPLFIFWKRPPPPAGPKLGDARLEDDASMSARGMIDER